MKRRGLIAAVTFAVAAFAAPTVVHASPPSDRGRGAASRAPWQADRIELRPLWTEPARVVAPEALRGLRALADIEPLEAFDLALPSQPPSDFRLQVRLGSRVTLYVSSDIAGGGVPRLDAMDFETYFTTGAELALWRSLRLFVEDYQPAFMVLGAELEEPPPERYWDGHQCAVGLRFDPAERVALEAGPIFYVLSVTRRPEDVGFALSLRLVL